MSKIGKFALMNVSNRFFATFFCGLGIFSTSLTVSAQSSDFESILEQGRDAFLDYDFEAARKHYADYRAKMKRAKKSVSEDAEVYERQLGIAERQLELLQNIVVIDSVSVKASDFFKHVRIPASAGFLLPPEKIPFRDGREAASMAFVPESGSLMMWAQLDSLGNSRIVESQRLTDGSYSTPVMTQDILNGGGDADFPTLSADGLTLYFSSDGEESMGGYDIFQAVRDPATGEYLPPSNVGMPFNSPYDDFMMVVDEENGVGWWATDRNQIEDMVTLYVYILPEMRENFDGEDDERISRARLDNYHLTWNLDEPDEESEDGATDDNNGEKLSAAEKMAKYNGLAKEIRSITPGKMPEKDDFVLPVGGGRFITKFDQLPDARSRQLMKEYLAEKARLDSSEQDLDKLRREYAKKPSDQLGLKIEALENAVDQQRLKTIGKLSEVYKNL